MPLYEYECRQCGERLEMLQRMGDPPLTACPKCGGELRKLFSAPAVQFKGSGWYVTDYAGKGRSSTKDEGAKSEEKPAKPSAGADSAKSAASAESASSSTPEKPASKPAKGD